MEDFKEVHKALEDMRSSAYSTAEIKKVWMSCRIYPVLTVAQDIGHMEDEKVQLTKRVERLKQKAPIPSLHT